MRLPLIALPGGVMAVFNRGAFDIMVGSPSEDIGLRDRLQVQE
jgi:hypothetical protein